MCLIAMGRRIKLPYICFLGSICAKHGCIAIRQDIEGVADLELLISVDCLVEKVLRKFFSFSFCMLVGKLAQM